MRPLTTDITPGSDRTHPTGFVPMLDTSRGQVTI
jgi:hypothetical protein